MVTLSTNTIRARHIPLGGNVALHHAIRDTVFLSGPCGSYALNMKYETHLRFVDEPPRSAPWGPHLMRARTAANQQAAEMWYPRGPEAEILMCLSNTRQQFILHTTATNLDLCAIVIQALHAGSVSVISEIIEGDGDSGRGVLPPAGSDGGVMAKCVPSSPARTILAPKQR